MTDEILAWLQFSVDMEKKGLTFYRACLEKATDQRAVELFKWLIEEEERHEKAISKMLAEKSGNDPKRVAAALAKFQKLGAYDAMFSKEDLEKITGKGTMLMEQFNFAAAMEKRGIDIYLDLEAGHHDPDVKKLFHEIAKQELRHRKKIVAVSMSLLGMEADEDEISEGEEEDELASQKTVLREIAMKAEKCEFTPRDIVVNKGETVLLKLKAVDAPAGFRCINFQLNEYVRPGNEAEMRFVADTAGEFEYFSNVPCYLGNAKMKGKIIIKGTNVHDDDL